MALEKGTSASWAYLLFTVGPTVSPGTARPTCPRGRSGRWIWACPPARPERLLGSAGPQRTPMRPVEIGSEEADRAGSGAVVGIFISALPARLIPMGTRTGQVGLGLLVGLLIFLIAPHRAAAIRRVCNVAFQGTSGRPARHTLSPHERIG